MTRLVKGFVQATLSKTDKPVDRTLRNTASSLLLARFDNRVLSFSVRSNEAADAAAAGPWRRFYCLDPKAGMAARARRNWLRSCNSEFLQSQVLKTPPIH
jgi:hypothetical protein